MKTQKKLGIKIKKKIGEGHVSLHETFSHKFPLIIHFEHFTKKLLD